MLLSTVYCLNSLRWTIPAAALTVPSPVVFSALQVLRMLKPILPTKLFEECDEIIWSMYQRMILCFFSNVNGAQVVFSGDYESFAELKENAIVLSNHQTSVDWIVMDIVAAQQHATGKMRFMLKDELKYIPLFGLYFWQHGCVNVKRFGAFDESRSIQQLAYLREAKIPTWFVVFPEGTRFNPDKQHVLFKSQQYAENNGLCVLGNLLTPRSRGTYLAISNLRSHVRVVYDITIAYESSRVKSTQDKGWIRKVGPGMVEFVLSYSPRFHVHIKRISIDEIPVEEQALSLWLHDLYVAKDKLMNQFIETGSFTSNQSNYQPATRWSQTLPPTLLFLTLTGLVLSSRQYRTAYAVVTLAGSIGSIAWMALH